MITVRCRRCGQSVPDYASFCPRCGSPSGFFEWTEGSNYQDQDHQEGRTQVLYQNNQTSESLPPYRSLVGSGGVHDQSTLQRKIAYHTTEYGTAQPYILLDDEERGCRNLYQASSYNPVGYVPDNSGRTVNLNNNVYPGGVQYSSQSMQAGNTGGNTFQNTSVYKPSTEKLYRDRQEEQEDNKRKEKEIRNRNREKQWNNVRKDAGEVISTTSGIHSFLGQILLIMVWVLFLGLTLAYITGLFKVIAIGGIDLSVDITASYKETFVIGILCVLLLSFIPGRLTVGFLKINAGTPAAMALMLISAFVSLFFEIFYPVSDYRVTAVAAAIGTLLGLSFLQPKYKKPDISRLLWACLLTVLLTVLLGITGLPQLKYLWDVFLKTISSIILPSRQYVL